MSPQSAASRMAENYPSGWFVAAFSGEVKAGAVHTSRVAGEDVVLYRTRSGVLRGTRPACPHLGAHLGHGGRVEGEDLVCPFHAFAFGPEGECVRTSYGKPPPQARLASVPLHEVDGMIFAWYHPGGDAPDWRPEAMDTTGFGRPWSWAKNLGGHPLDLNENSIDTGHFAALHGGGRVRELEPMTLDGPRLRSVVAFDGFYYLSKLRAEFDIRMFGLGYLAVRVHLPQIRLTLLELCSWVPTDPGRQRFHKLTYTRIGRPQALPRGVRTLVTALGTPAAVLAGLGSVQQIGADKPIWAHRTYLEQPRIAAGDGPIMKYRHWAQQFYPEPGAAESAPARSSGSRAISAAPGDGTLVGTGKRRTEAAVS